MSDLVSRQSRENATVVSLACPSPRWHPLEWNEAGNHWTARVRHPITVRQRAAGLEPAVHGPTEWACVAETVRQDRLWADLPNRTGDTARARQRLAFLAGGLE